MSSIKAPRAGFLKSWWKGLSFFLILLLVAPFAAWAKPTTARQAQQVVQNWLSPDRLPLGAQLGQVVKEVRAYDDGSGRALYYIVYVQPAGFVIVPADDLVEPIIGFLSEGAYDPSPQNPLGALVSRDLPGRLAQVRRQEAQAREAGREFAPKGLNLDARRKWGLLQQTTSSNLESGLPNISDVRVSPLVQSRWSQSKVAGVNCYNYYTPNNYVCGCVATAMSQLMRLHEKPSAGVGTGSYLIRVDGVYRYENLRGGDGAGGPYVWSSMPLVPDGAITEAQRQAIGALTHDTGISVNMSYKSGGSSADTLAAADALKYTFGYSNAKQGYNSASNLPSNKLYGMVNPNLDASWPVLLGITGDPGGHAIVCDGYGYDSGTIYHHLNMGWSGSNDAWYNLPTIDTTIGTFTSVYKCVYNVYVTGSGEIISGRVLDGGGNPISGAAVSAGGGYSTTTNSKGIYALGKVPSGSGFTVTAGKTGYTFTPQSVTTGTSTDYNNASGNLWGINFTGSGTGLDLSQILLLLLD